MLQQHVAKMNEKGGPRFQFWLFTFIGKNYTFQKKLVEQKH